LQSRRYCARWCHSQALRRSARLCLSPSPRLCSSGSMPCVIPIAWERFSARPRSRGRHEPADREPNHRSAAAISSGQMAWPPCGGDRRERGNRPGLLAAGARPEGDPLWRGHVRPRFSFAQVSLCAITVPLAGVLVLKRQWMLGKRYGFVTPREMLGEYYDSEFLRILVLIFAVPFTGMQINAAYISNGSLDRVGAMWLLSGIVFVHVGFGGLRARLMWALCRRSCLESESSLSASSYIGKLEVSAPSTSRLAGWARAAPQAHTHLRYPA
jgi:hypothetical protein